MSERLVAIDTNLLVLFVVGTTSSDLIIKHKRTRSYTIDDFHLLQKIIAQSDRLVVTPNVLTETSNLIRQFKPPEVERIINTYKDIAQRSVEFYVESSLAVSRGEFDRLGLTDASLIDGPFEKITLITDDFDLYQTKLSQGEKVINFSHERELWLRV